MAVEWGWCWASLFVLDAFRLELPMITCPLLLPNLGILGASRSNEPPFLLDGNFLGDTLPTGDTLGASFLLDCSFLGDDTLLTGDMRLFPKYRVFLCWLGLLRNGRSGNRLLMVSKFGIKLARTMS